MKVYIPAKQWKRRKPDASKVVRQRKSKKVRPARKGETK